MPIEKQPANPVPSNYVPPGWRALYRVRDNDTWESVARHWRVDVGRLIRHNFNLPDGVPYDPAEVNWYLRHRVGCKLTTADGKNWRFTSAADPGWLFIPPVSSLFPWGKCADWVVQPHSLFVLSADRVQIPLPSGKVWSGAKVTVCGDHDHGYVVRVSNPKGISSDARGAVKSIGIGVGSATGQQVAKHLSLRAFARTVAGFVGSRIGGGVIGVFVPNKAGDDSQSLDQLLPDGLLVHYAFFD